MPAQRKTTIFYTDTGGGHRATALALKDVLTQLANHTVTLCNPYRDLVADYDLFPNLIGYPNEEVYNRFVLGKNWPSVFCLLFYGLTLINVKFGTRRSIRRFLAYWQDTQPDLVISVMPFANHGIYRSMKDYRRQSPVPFLIVITDLCEQFPRSWFPADNGYYIACGTEKSYDQARRKKHPENLLFQTSGLPVHPSFYETQDIDKNKARTTLGLKPDLPTGCMMYGTAGSPRMLQLARHLQSSNYKGQIIFLCGHNQSLADALKACQLRYPHIILNYTENVAYYFALADFLICKPGPGTISEAHVCGLSLLVDCQNVLPQERYNVTWIKRHGLGSTFRDSQSFLQAINQLMTRVKTSGAPLTFPTIPRNRSIYEIAEIAQKITDASPAQR